MVSSITNPKIRPTFDSESKSAKNQNSLCDPHPMGGGGGSGTNF